MRDCDGKHQIWNRIRSQNYSGRCFVASFINTLSPRQDGRRFPDGIFKCIFLNENVWIPIKISMKFVPKGPIKNIPALVQIMAWRCPGDKPLSEPMMVSLTTHICITRPQWVKEVNLGLAKRPLVFNGRLANRGLTSLVKPWWHIACGVFAAAVRRP